MRYILILSGIMGTMISFGILSKFQPENPLVHSLILLLIPLIIMSLVKGNNNKES